MTETGQDTLTAAPPLTYPQRLAQIAAEQPDKVAIRWVVEGEELASITYRTLCRAADRLARRFKAEGANADSIVAIVLPNGIPFFVAMIAAWRIGACPVPLKYDLTPAELRPLLELTRPASTVTLEADGAPGAITAAEIEQMIREAGTGASVEDGERLPDVTPLRCWGIASGGSTGKPKIILNLRAATMAWQFAKMSATDEPTIQLICLPLYHTSALSMSVQSLLAGDTIILLPRFNPALVIDAVERYEVTLLSLVSSAMVRLLKLPDLTAHRLRSVRTIITGAGAFADEMMQAWARLVGAEKIIFGFGASEGIGGVMITGDELLKRPGTVGKPASCEVRILDEDGIELPAGDVGEIFLRNLSGDSADFDYLGGEAPRKRPDGFVSVGDVGWVDAEGYLYISDRRTDMIKTGGVNVFPAEVEAVLTTFPAIIDAAVIGLPDPDWGRALHAILVAVNPASPPEVEDIRQFLRERLTVAKIPKTFEFLPSLGRAETMKLNRRTLTEERIARAAG